MTGDNAHNLNINPVPEAEHVTEHLSNGELNDLCDATYHAIENGGGFGWVTPPARQILERYWNGVITMPARELFVARLDRVICGTAQLIHPPENNEAQQYTVHMTSLFIAPWARQYGLARLLLDKIETHAKARGYRIINLDVRETQAAAIRLYEGAGYTCFGRHPYYAIIDDTVVAGRYYYKCIDDTHPETDGTSA